MTASTGEYPIHPVNSSLRVRGSYDIRIPPTFCHYRRLQQFCQYNRENLRFNRMESGLNDYHFRRPSGVMSPGQKFNVRFYQAIADMTLDAALLVMRNERASMVSAQGLTVLWETLFENLPHRWVFSLDERSALPIIQSEHAMPYLFKGSGGSVSFHTMPSSRGVKSESILAVFKEIP